MDVFMHIYQIHILRDLAAAKYFAASLCRREKEVVWNRSLKIVKCWRSECNSVVLFTKLIFRLACLLLAGEI